MRMRALTLGFLMLFPPGELTRDLQAQSRVPDTPEVVASRVSAWAPDSLGLWIQALTLLPDGRAGVIPAWGSCDLLLYEPLVGEARRLTHANDDERCWIWTVSASPNGRTVAYNFYLDGADSASLNAVQLRLLDLETGTRRILDDLPLGGAIEPQGWSSDGTALAAVRWARDEAEIVVFSASDGDPLQVYPMEHSDVGRVVFSPEGRHLIYEMGPEMGANRSLYVLDLETGRDAPLEASSADERLIGWLPRTNRIAFVSDRSGTSSIWTLQIEDGRAVGSATLVAPDFSSTQLIGQTGIDSYGRLHYAHQTGFRSVAMASLDEGGTPAEPETLLADSVEVAARISWSPDGGSVAVLIVSEHSSEVVIRHVEQAEDRTYPLPGGLRPGFQLSWTPDAAHVLMLGDLFGQMEDRVLYRLDVATGASRVFELKSETPGVLNQFAPLPGGLSVLVRRRVPPATPEDENVTTLYLRDLESGTEREIYQVRGTGLQFAVSPDGSAVTVLQNLDDRIHAERVPLDGDGPRSPLDTSVLTGTAGNWSYQWDPTGSTLLALGQVPDRPEARMLVRIPADGGPITTSIITVPEGAGAVALSPRGDRLSWVMGSLEWELWVLEGLGRPVIPE